MKLYATTTSERATKGQGGNQWVETKLSLNEVEVMQAGLIKIDNETYHFKIKSDGKTLVDRILKTKAEK